MKQRRIRHWIELNDERHEKHFEWVSGDSSGFRNWDEDTPEGGWWRPNCVWMNGYYDGLWLDYKCYDKNPFVCER